MDKINRKDIFKIALNTYFDNPELNKRLKEKTQKLMFYAHWHKSKECLMIFSIESFRHKVCTDKDENKVGFNAKMRQILRERDKRFIVIHNHPTDTSFSLMDLKEFLQYPNVLMMMVCTNSCKYCAAVLKDAGFDERKQELLDEWLDRQFKSGQLNEHGSALEILSRLHQRGLMYYVEYENY